VTLPKTPSQTVGPFYAIGLCRRDENELAERSAQDAIQLVGRLVDGAGVPIADGLIEVWDRVGGSWGRCGTDGEGGFSFVVTKPEAAGPGGAPRFDVYVHARGLLRHQLTRVYFPDEAEANERDPVLSSLAGPDRETLVAMQENGALRFDIRMQGERATVFFAH
jgi:protocatechuate 3,4-dioxygenase, alpha subunit